MLSDPIALRTEAKPIPILEFVLHFLDGTYSLYRKQ